MRRYFYEINKVPRPSENTVAMQEYLSVNTGTIFFLRAGHQPETIYNNQPNNDTMNTLDGEDSLSLRKLAVLGACLGPVKISSQPLGEMLGTSQQTAARRILSLEKEGMISRTTESSGQYILITKEGEEHLRREFSEYSKIFERGSEKYVLTGTVVSGVGEGRYYVSIPHYLDIFSKLCGFKPYLGTLNVRLNPQSMQIRNRMESMEWIIVPGFKDENRQFGEARLLKCKISGYDCAIVAPGRTHHPPEITEIICAERLRDKLQITDGDMVEIIVE